jgi:hypothetical protein
VERRYIVGSAKGISGSHELRADEIKSPLLLIHGERDNNPGTPIELAHRLWSCCPTRDMAPGAKESIGHMLWEVTSWLDRHLKAEAAARPR